MQYLYAVSKPLEGRLYKALSAQSLNNDFIICPRKESLNMKIECTYFKLNIEVSIQNSCFIWQQAAIMLIFLVYGYMVFMKGVCVRKL